MTQRQQVEIKQIKDLIYGYIHELEVNCKPLRIPYDIKRLCLRFYILYEYFTIHGNKILINKSRNIAIGTTNTFVSNTAYGHHIVDLDDDTIKKHIWNLNVYELKLKDKFYIGLNDINCSRPNKAKLSYAFRSDGFNYGQDPFACNPYGAYITLSLETYKTRIWNDQMKQYDLIRKHILSVGRGQVSFHRQEVKSTKASKYRFGAIISHISQRIEILKYEVINYPLDNDRNLGQGLAKYVSSIWDFF